jgi:hypothetical protein
MLSNSVMKQLIHYTDLQKGMYTKWLNMTYTIVGGKDVKE